VTGWRVLVVFLEPVPIRARDNDNARCLLQEPALDVACDLALDTAIDFDFEVDLDRCRALDERVLVFLEPGAVLARADWRFEPVLDAAARDLDLAFVLDLDLEIELDRCQAADAALLRVRDVIDLLDDDVTRRRFDDVRDDELWRRLRAVAAAAADDDDFDVVLLPLLVDLAAHDSTQSACTRVVCKQSRQIFHKFPTSSNIDMQCISHYILNATLHYFVQ